MGLFCLHTHTHTHTHTHIYIYIYIYIYISGHIATCSDKDPKYFMFPFYKMNCDSILARKEKEKYFINKFKPELNSI